MASEEVKWLKKSKHIYLACCGCCCCFCRIFASASASAYATAADRAPQLLLFGLYSPLGLCCCDGFCGFILAKDEAAWLPGWRLSG